MPARRKTYQVISARPVTVDFPGGNTMNYRNGHRFIADPSNRNVVRLLRLNLIREVTPRELSSQDPSRLGSQS